jgi:hypothetical protein
LSPTYFYQKDEWIKLRKPWSSKFYVSQTYDKRSDSHYNIITIIITVIIISTSVFGLQSSDG